MGRRNSKIIYVIPKTTQVILRRGRRSITWYMFWQFTKTWMRHIYNGKA